MKPGGWLYYIASPANATQRYLYRSRLDGSGKPERVTPAAAAARTPTTFRRIAAGRSTPTRGSTRPASRISSACPITRSSASSRTTRRSRRRWSPCWPAARRCFRWTSAAGVSLDGWLIKPRAFDPSKKYPVIVYVYGEPAGTTVTDSWGGSGPHAAGRAGRRWVPGRELRQPGHAVAEGAGVAQGRSTAPSACWRRKEQAAALRALAASHPYVDLSRVAVYGWSGGGSMTLNLMFRSPELYKVGVAGRAGARPDAVRLDLPGTLHGPAAAERRGLSDGSPITFADGLQGKLLDHPRHRRRQRALPGHAAAAQPADRAEQAVQLHGVPEPAPRHLGHPHRDAALGFIKQHLPAGPR